MSLKNIVTKKEREKIKSLSKKYDRFNLILLKNKFKKILNDNIIKYENETFMLKCKECGNVYYMDLFEVLYREMHHMSVKCKCNGDPMNLVFTNKKPHNHRNLVWEYENKNDDNYFITYGDNWYCQINLDEYNELESVYLAEGEDDENVVLDEDISNNSLNELDKLLKGVDYDINLPKEICLNEVKFFDSEAGPEEVFENIKLSIIEKSDISLYRLLAKLEKVLDNYKDTLYK